MLPYGLSKNAVIVAKPARTAVTTPRSLTVTTALLSDDHLTAAPSTTGLDPPLAMRTLTVNAAVSPSLRVRTPPMINLLLSTIVTGAGGVVVFEQPADIATSNEYTAKQ